MSTEDTGADLQAAHMRILEVFGAVCAEPDDPAVAREADEALARLDRMLAAAAAN
jgi:hypothetical protein